jgi:hypothetical protein
VWFKRRDDSKKEAEEALANAEKASEEIQKQGSEISALADAFREFRERNHFAEQLEEIIVRKRGGYSR